MTELMKSFAKDWARWSQAERAAVVVSAAGLALVFAAHAARLLLVRL